MNKQFPLVVEGDFGIRPAGKPDECFYCHSKIGEPHGPECVCIHRRVRVRYTFEFELGIPYFWDADRFEFHRNQSSWCADNGVRDLQVALDDADENTCVMCPGFEAEFIDDVDDVPIRAKR